MHTKYPRHSGMTQRYDTRKTFNNNWKAQSVFFFLFSEATGSGELVLSHLLRCFFSFNEELSAVGVGLWRGTYFLNNDWLSGRWSRYGQPVSSVVTSLNPAHLKRCNKCINDAWLLFAPRRTSASF